MIENFVSVLEWLSLAISVFGLALLVLGVGRGALGWVRTELDREPWERRVTTIRKLRCMVGVHILYGLELMIVADIIDSFVAVVGAEAVGGSFFHGEVFYSLVQLSILVLIRTVIDYFLGKEISGLRADSA